MQQPPHNPARSLQVTFAFHAGRQPRRAAVRQTVSHAVCQRVSQRNACGTRFLSVRAAALISSSCAVGLRTLGLKSHAQILEISPLAQPSCPAAGARETHGKMAAARGFAPKLNTLRALAEFRFKAARSAPDPGPFLRLRLSHNRSGVGRASRLKHRIGRAWAHSLRFRSLGLANASDTTGSLSRWGATVAFLRLGASNCVSPVLGHLRGCPARAGAILAQSKSPALAVSARQQSRRAFKPSALACACSVLALLVHLAVNKSQSGDTTTHATTSR